MKNSPNLTLIAGPCVIESREMVLELSSEIRRITKKLNIRYVFKASFDKANRSSSESFRGPGLEKGLEILAEVKDKSNCEILTDIHESQQAKLAAEVVDIIQIPAFLCRQTDLLQSAAIAVLDKKKIINVKKGQFLAPWDMAQIVNKISEVGLEAKSGNLWLTERGNSFGYNTLVVDFRGLPQLRKLDCPVIFDATHSVQQPGGRGTSSGGQREFVAPLARAAVAVGVDGIFMEVHQNPENALSDGPNMVPIHRLEKLLKELISIKEIIGDNPSISSL